MKKKIKMERVLIKILLVLFLLILASPCIAARLHYESWYQDQWCPNNSGQTEVTMPDNTRCDCITATKAIEFDFSDKWAEAIGQSLHYASQTGINAGIVLIMESSNEDNYLTRLTSTIAKFNLPITVWLIKDNNSDGIVDDWGGTPLISSTTTISTLDVDGDFDADANDGLMIQRRLTGAGTVTTGIVLPNGVGGSESNGSKTSAEINSAIDSMVP